MFRETHFLILLLSFTNSASAGSLLRRRITFQGTSVEIFWFQSPSVAVRWKQRTFDYRKCWMERKSFLEFRLLSSRSLLTFVLNVHPFTSSVDISWYLFIRKRLFFYYSLGVIHKFYHVWIKLELWIHEKCFVFYRRILIILLHP